MTPVLQFIIDVVSLGSAYALMALGLVIIYGILRLVNFAYGELIMVVGYSLFLMKGSPLPWFVMAVYRGLYGDIDQHCNGLHRLSAGAGEVGHRRVDHLVRILDPAAERRTAVHLASSQERAAARRFPPKPCTSWASSCR